MYIKAIVSQNNTYNKIIIHSYRDKVDLLLYDKKNDFFPSKNKSFDSINEAKDWIEHWGEEFPVDWGEHENSPSRLFEITRWEKITIYQITYEYFVYIFQAITKTVTSLLHSTLKYISRKSLEFKRKYIKKQIEIRRQKIKDFQGSITLPSEKKEALYSAFRHRETSISENEMILNAISMFEFSTQSSLVMFLIFGGSVLLVNFLLGIKLGFWVGVASFLAIFLILLMLLALLKFVSLIDTFINTFLIKKLLLIAPILSLIAYILGFYYYSDILRNLLTNFWLASIFIGGLNSSLLLIIILEIIVVTDLLLKPLAKRRLRVQHPESVFVDELLNILLKGEQNHSPWDISYKQLLISQLESIASQLENNILYKLQYRDNNTKYWVKHEVQKISAATREIKKIIILPERHGRSLFLQTMAQFLEIAILGAWGELPKIEKPSEINFLQSLSVSFTFIIRTSFAITTPILGWVFFQSSPLAVQPPLSDYVTLGILAWSALSLLATIDPTYSSKISAIREITGIFNLKNKVP